MQFLVVLALVRGDGLAVRVPDREAQFGAPTGLDARGGEVEGVAVRGDLQAAGRGAVVARVPLALLLPRRRLAVLVVRRGSALRDDRVHAPAHAVGGAEGRGQCGGERGDPQSRVHGGRLLGCSGLRLIRRPLHARHHTPRGY